MAKETGGPAFPRSLSIHPHNNEIEYEQDGMDLRPYAAIHLRIPDSGIDWLDKMIAKAERRDIAAKIMPVIAYKKPLTPWATIAQNAYEAADAMIAERAKGE